MAEEGTSYMKIRNTTLTDPCNLRGCSVCYSLLEISTEYRRNDMWLVTVRRIYAMKVRKWMMRLGEGRIKGREELRGGKN